MIPNELLPQIERPVNELNARLARVCPELFLRKEHSSHGSVKTFTQQNAGPRAYRTASAPEMERRVFATGRTSNAGLRLRRGGGSASSTPGRRSHCDQYPPGAETSTDGPADQAEKLDRRHLKKLSPDPAAALTAHATSGHASPCLMRCKTEPAPVARMVGTANRPPVKAAGGDRLRRAWPGRCGAAGGGPNANFCRLVENLLRVPAIGVRPSRQKSLAGPSRTESAVEGECHRGRPASPWVGGPGARRPLEQDRD
jgi:hypothetical protein